MYPTGSADTLTKKHVDYFHRRHVTPGPQDPIIANAKFRLVVLRTKFGCTCNECVGGYLSSRARHVLKNQAEMLWNTLSEFISSWKFAEDLDTHIPQPARCESTHE